MGVSANVVCICPAPRGWCVAGIRQLELHPPPEPISPARNPTNAKRTHWPNRNGFKSCALACSNAGLMASTAEIGKGAPRFAAGSCESVLAREITPDSPRIVREYNGTHVCQARCIVRRSLFFIFSLHLTVGSAPSGLFMERTVARCRRKTSHRRRDQPLRNSRVRRNYFP